MQSYNLQDSSGLHFFSVETNRVWGRRMTEGRHGETEFRDKEGERKRKEGRGREIRNLPTRLTNVSSGLYGSLIVYGFLSGFRY